MSTHQIGTRATLHSALRCAAVARTRCADDPYLRLMRLDRPIGAWLLWLPAAWAISMVARPASLPGLLIAFALAAVLLRGAGCAVNDIVDRRYDAQVARTRGRPLAAGELSVGAAIVFAIGLETAGLALIAIVSTTAALTVATSIPAVAVYPAMKRLIAWPQAWLGLTFNLFALAGWIAAAGRLTSPAIALYFAAAVWTLGYDTIYAHQDRDDDAALGLHSTALRFDRRPRRFVGSCYALALALLAAAGMAARGGGVFLVALAGAAVQAAWQIAGWQPNEPADCGRIFKSNLWLGLLVLWAVVIARCAV